MWKIRFVFPEEESYKVVCVCVCVCVFVCKMGGVVEHCDFYEDVFW